MVVDDTYTRNSGNKMNGRVIATTLCVLAAGAVGAEGTLFKDRTVEELDLTRYAGRWFQVYGSLSTEIFSSRYCVAADYKLREDGTVGVFNQGRKESVTGPPTNITGSAFVTDPATPGRLTVRLDGTPADGRYWVYGLGPATFNGTQYEWSIVSDNLRFNLFILARDVAAFKRDYEVEVLEKVSKLWFVFFWNKPRETFQDGCVYAPSPL